LLPILALLFFVSGACALIYQVMWMRLLALVFGVTVYAASTVLASFMAGLALGSYGAGRIAGRLRHPLRAFGIVEIGIGLSALATPLLLEEVTRLWVVLSPSLPSSLPLLTAARFIAAVLVLIVPTTLMGATLPLVLRSALVSDQALGRRIGLLYAINTAGAIAGALTAGFYFVAEIGASRSFQIAALLNVAVGLGAIAASRRLAATRPLDLVRPDGPVTTADAAGAPDELPRGQRRAVLVTFFLSGVMSLALEIVWFRMLVTLLRPTAYAFTIMLAAVLAGIAAGSALATPLLARRSGWLPILTVVQLVISIAAVLSFNALGLHQPVDEFLVPRLVTLGLEPYFGPILVASAMAMLPTTLLLGFAFPIGLSLWTGHVHGASRRIGVFYSLNVFGAIAGSVLGGFVLLPLLGSRGSLIAASTLAILSSVYLAVTQWRTRPNFAGFVAIVGPVAFTMAAMNAIDPFVVAMADHRRDRLLWRQEGVQTTVEIHEQRGGSSRIMYLDGMHQASDYPQMAFVHHRIGALPVMLHPNPADALVVGLGGGATAGAVARYPGMTVDVVELSGAVVGGAAFFTHINFDLLKRPNVVLRVDDGRNYLLTTRKKYDVITADIILPRHAGAGALYSREYFQLVRNAMKDDGLVLQWNGGESDTTYRLILRTFLSVFPETTLWADGTLMVGSLQPFTFSRRAYERRYQDPRFRELFDWDFTTVADMYLAGPPELRTWVGEGPVLTDDRPIIEYFLSLPANDGPADLSGLARRPEQIVRP
jgi:spermidine synthase